MEPGEAIRERHGDAFLISAPQLIVIALIGELGAHARQQLAFVDRLGEIVVHAELQGLGQALIVLLVDQDQNDAVPAGTVGAQLRAKPQGVVIEQPQADDNQVVPGFGFAERRLGRVHDEHFVVLVQHRRDDGGIVLVVFNH